MSVLEASWEQPSTEWKPLCRPLRLEPETARSKRWSRGQTIPALSSVQVHVHSLQRDGLGWRRHVSLSSKQDGGNRTRFSTFFNNPFQHFLPQECDCWISLHIKITCVFYYTAEYLILPLWILIQSFQMKAEIWIFILMRNPQHSPRESKANRASELENPVWANTKPQDSNSMGVILTS